MMSSSEIRQQFFDFFKSKKHTIVPSAPIVLKDDPTLLFTNAGMNQFKDYFLGNMQPPYKRVADTQKCLRVSGKHNDLEEVGVDTYHHTMFEMLGNWSFGDYFKKEAIAWGWELLTEIYKIPKENLYVTVFEGDAKESLPKDEEAIAFWKEWIDEDRIVMGNKKDNFWEMGDTGPCGPCTEIHFDGRSEEDKIKIAGKNLVNKDDPHVIEIWNIVFIEYNRKKNGSLEPLPARHVDTGMGFERLVRVLQNKQSNYNTDIFTGIIAEVEKLSNKKYTNTDSKQDVAFRVIADHIRAIAFPIADGQLPSNTGAGYVIRRILRRAVRYYFSYLDVKEPLLYKLISLLSEQFKNVFSELEKQKDFITKVVHEEEQNFLRTLDKGLARLDKYFETLGQEPFSDILFGNSTESTLKRLSEFVFIKDTDNPTRLSVPGSIVFELFDTFGFPVDLTMLIAKEKNWDIDEEGFDKEMKQQKKRSRVASEIEKDDWEILSAEMSSKFNGYNNFHLTTFVTKYRKVNFKGNYMWQIVVADTPFYAESGGQVGDTGEIEFLETKQKVRIINTVKENDLIFHITDQKPYNFLGQAIAKIDINRRKAIQIHHTATHLMHAALRQVLGKHVTQKGSLVNDEHLRFDFSHFAKVADEELANIEAIVNEKIRENIPVVIKEMKKEEAIAMGAMALFGEKYADVVRVVIIDPAYSIELCGGTHVGNTGELGILKIKHETAVGAGVRRIEAVSGKAAEDFINDQFDIINSIRQTLKNPKDISKAIENLIMENGELKKQLEKLEVKQLSVIKNDLLKKTETINAINFIGQLVDVQNADSLKKICFSLKNELKDYFVILATAIDNKPYIAIMIDESVASSKNIDANRIIKEQVTPLIKGGGGGQKTLATAGGQDAKRLKEVIEKVKALLQ